MKKISTLLLITSLIASQLFAQKPYRQNLAPSFTAEAFNISMGTNPPGTFDFHPENDIKLLPNPFSETAHMLINLPEKEFSLSIFDFSGRKLRDLSTKDGTFTIDGKNLQQGTYLYLLQSKDGKVKYTGKFEIVR